MLQKYFIKRTSPNTGIVYAWTMHCKTIDVSENMSYTECKHFVKEHQEELKVYKVARILNRKNAKRTLYEKVLAADSDEALCGFYEICKRECDDSRLQLLTGDWKIIAERDCNGLIKLI